MSFPSGCPSQLGRRSDGSFDPSSGRPPVRFITGVLRQALTRDVPVRLSRRREPLRFSRKDFIRHVLAVYPQARRVHDDSFEVPWSGDRTIYLTYGPDENHVWLQFANDDDETAYSHHKTLQPGSLNLFRSLSVLVNGFREAGLNLSFEAEPRREALYHKLLTKSGYRRVSKPQADPVYGPIPSIQSPDAPKDRLITHARGGRSVRVLFPSV